MPLFYFFADRQTIYKFIFPYDCLIDHRVWIKTVGGGGCVLKFPAPCDPALTKIWMCHLELHRMTPNRTQRIRHETYPAYAVPRVASPKFSPVSLCDQPFSRYCIFRISPLIPQIAKTFITFYSPMTTFFVIQFGSDQIKIVGVAFWNFCSNRVPR